MPNMAATVTPATDAGTLLDRARAARARQDADTAAQLRERGAQAESDARERLITALAHVLDVTVDPAVVRVEVRGTSTWDVDARPYIDVDGLTFTAWRCSRGEWESVLVLAVARPCVTCGETVWERVEDLAHLATVVDAPTSHRPECPRDVDDDAPATIVARTPTPAERLAAAVAEIARAVARDVESESDGY